MASETSYLGLRLAHPFVAGASPFGYRLDSVKRLEDAGCAAIVLHSLFEEQVTASREGRVRGLDVTGNEWPGIVSAFPSPDEYALSPDAYAEHVQRVKQAVRIPVIGSLNGTSPEAWLRFARVIEEAGADALEMNLYEVVTDPQVSGAAVESQLVSVVKDLKRTLRIPVAVKLPPYFSAFANLAHRLDDVGADALVVFNRFYQPDIDIRTMQTVPRLELSTSAELLLRLRWVAILHGRVRAELAVTGGVATPNDGVKAILAGATIVQLTTALLRHGPAYVSAMKEGLEQWLEWHHFERLDEARGLCGLSRTADPGAFERAQYIRALQSWPTISS